MESQEEQGLEHLRSNHSVFETVNTLESLLLGRGVKVFARIDHAAEAAKAGLAMRPTEVLIFGSPKAGTPLMLAAPTLAIDLPLKALVWEDHAGLVRLSWNTPEYLGRRHGVPQAMLPAIAQVRAIFEEAAR